MNTLKSDLYRQPKRNFHLLPGRLRIGVPGLLNNQELAHLLAHHATKFPGVGLCYANPITGQVLLNFDPQAADLKELLAWIFYASGKDSGAAADPSLTEETAGFGFPAQEKPAGDALFERQKFAGSCLPAEQRPAGQQLPAKQKSGGGLFPAQWPAAPLPATAPAMPWHLLDSSQVLALLGTSRETGLTYQAVQGRLITCGHNELKEGAKPSFWQMARGSLDGFMSKLLLAAGGVSLLVGEKADAAVIVAIVVIQAAVEAAQSCRAEKSLENLKKLSAPVAAVLREGEILRIPSRELVPGDILKLDAGDVVPADAMLIEAANLTTNEACLTGESIPVEKDSQKRNVRQAPVADQTNMLFSGTSITGGRATAVVVTTGMQTELGRVARLLRDVQSEQTNLQKQLDYLGKKITHLVVLSVGTIAVIHLLRGRPLWDVLRSGISLAIGAVPEGLPAILTVALTMGVQRMVKRNAVVRNIAAVETLGSTTVICTDKTGTLTKNEMTVKELYIDHIFYEVTGDGYQPAGKILPRAAGGSGGNGVSGGEGWGAAGQGSDGRGDGGVFRGGDGPDGNPRDGKGAPAFVTETLKAAALCNNAELKPGLQGKWVIIGDPTEVALLTAAAKGGLWWQDLKKEHCRCREIAFDARRRLMIVACREPDGAYGVYVKGAPDAVINHCAFSLGEPEKKVMDLKTRNKILAANEAMARKALRVLAVACKRLPPGTDLAKADLEGELTFCGLAGMSDTPRQGVSEAIEKCRNAGIKVIMITGDHQKTAEAVAVKLGLLVRGKSITGKELEHISDGDFVEQVENIAVYSRTTPDQKLKIVRALKNRGQIVAMTGDGVNDAPAIKEADIGIAMGLSGTEVTRGAADITLSDDNFVTIVNGIEEGRAVSMNLSKSVRYILSGSLAQLLTVFTTAVLGLPAPLLPAQILWVNLVTESLPAMSLMADPPETDYMQRPPLNPKEGFLPDQGRAILRKGMLFSLSTFGLYAVGLRWGGWSLEKARTMAFAQLVINRAFSLLHEHKANRHRVNEGRAEGSRADENGVHGRRVNGCPGNEPGANGREVNRYGENSFGECVCGESECRKNSFRKNRCETNGPETNGCSSAGPETNGCRPTGTKSSGVKENPLILPAAALSALMLAITIYLPFMRPLFSTVPVGPKEWVLLTANALATGKIDSFLEIRNKG